MFQKGKYNKSNQGSLKDKSNLNLSFQLSKYHSNIYSKKISLCKKVSLQNNPSNKFTQNYTWKKKNSHNNWNKENDKNYLNYEKYNNSNNDPNQYYYIPPKEKKENKLYYNKEHSHLYSYENSEYNSNNKNKNSQKNEKNFSVDNTTTQSNSSSHEELNNNQNNFNDNNSTVTKKNYISNEFQTLNTLNTEEENNKYSINNIKSDLKNINSYISIKEKNNISSNEENNINIGVQTKNNVNNKNPMISTPKQQKKNKKIKKSQKNVSSKELEIKKSISSNIENDCKLNEPYNKFNSVNNELNTPIINPITENTEILQVNVKIAKDKNVIFKLRRFDDLFLTVKLFCEINSIEEKLMKPIITKALCTLNSIYQIYNTQLDSTSISVLKMLKTFNSETSL